MGLIQVPLNLKVKVFQTNTVGLCPLASNYSTSIFWQLLFIAVFPATLSLPLPELNYPFPHLSQQHPRHAWESLKFISLNKQVPWIRAICGVWLKNIYLKMAGCDWMIVMHIKIWQSFDCITAGILTGNTFGSPCFGREFTLSLYIISSYPVSQQRHVMDPVSQRIPIGEVLEESPLCRRPHPVEYSFPRGWVLTLLAFWKGMKTWLCGLAWRNMQPGTG